MLFNSYVFIFLYLPVALLGFFLFARWNFRAAAVWLAAASLFFYGWWNPKFLLVLLFSILFNYAAGYLISKAPDERKKSWLVVAVAINLVVLCVFKYANFFIATANSGGAHLPLLDIVLPLGISFFTFTQIAFLVDVYKGKAREYDFTHYLLFVTWFPHLIAGPVLHHKQMMPQFSLPSTYRINTENFSVGLTLFAMGLFKKVILADQFGLYSAPVFDSASKGLYLSFWSAWAGALAYTLQLYFDFSGYSDMAIGLSRMFNVKLPLNFNSPYKAANIIEFWRRWHMTLSSFLRDYLYIALGGNRKGPTRRYVNLFITMVLGGLWHGAGWGFIFWGALHGLYLVVNHGWRWIRGHSDRPVHRANRALGVLLTFTAVVVAWVAFRSSSLESAWILWQSMAALNGVSFADFSMLIPGMPNATTQVVCWLSGGLLIVWFLPNTQELLAQYAPAWDEVRSASRIRWRLTRTTGVIGGLALGVSLLGIGRVSEFLYFQF